MNKTQPQKTIKIKARHDYTMSTFKKYPLFLWFDKFLNRDESQNGTGKGTSLYSVQCLLISTGIFFQQVPPFFLSGGLPQLKLQV